MAIKQSILDVVNQIKTIPFLNNAGATPNLYSAIWNNQFKRLEDGQSYSFPIPAAFVELIPQKDGGEIGYGVWGYDVIFRIHAAINQPDAGDGTLDQNLIIYDLRDALANALVHFQPSQCGMLQSDDETFDYDHESLYLYTFDLKCHFIETDGNKYPTNESVPVTKLILIDGYAPIEILSVGYSGGVLTAGYKLVDDVQSVSISVTPGATYTHAATDGKNTFTQPVSLSSGNYTLTITGAVNNFTTEPFKFTI